MESAEGDDFLSMYNYNWPVDMLDIDNIIEYSCK